MKRLLSVSILVGAAWVLAPTSAKAGSGFYLSGELGAHLASEADFAGRSTDRPSVCDEFINPDYASVTGCTAPGRGSNTGWKSRFDDAGGILAGAALGYRFRERFPDRPWGRFRVELEYFYRDSEYDETTAVTNAQGDNFAKLGGEILRAEESLGSLTSHNLFGNLYLDFANGSRFTPYIGFGVGVAFAEADWGSVWERNPDPNRIATGAGQPNAAEIRSNLAGTASRARVDLEDTLFGYQILVGVDYELTDAVSLGLKARWVDFGSFGDDLGWNPLRSHPPHLRRDGGEPVKGIMRTADTEMFGIALNLKYDF